VSFFYALPLRLRHPPPSSLFPYTTLFRSAMMPTAKISSVVYMLSSPIMAELQTDIEAMRRAFFRAVRLTAAIGLPASVGMALVRSEEHTSELQSRFDLVCRLLLEKKKQEP